MTLIQVMGFLSTSSSTEFTSDEEGSFPVSGFRFPVSGFHFFVPFLSTVFLQLPFIRQDTYLEEHMHV
jgi:hypothetical protein